jgi:uncharacterized protein
MNWDWPSVATLAAVAVSWVGIWWMRKRELNFSLVALFALTIGIPIGIVAGEHVKAVNPIGRVYINVLLATVAPLVFVAIVSAMTSLGTLAKLKSIGLRSTFWLLLSNALAVVMALGLAFVFRPGEGTGATLGAVPADTIEAQVQSFGQVFTNFFPTNVVGSFGSDAIIPIILIAVTVSIAYLSLAERQGETVKLFADGIEAVKLVVFKVVTYVIRLTPYAIVALTAHMVGMSTDLGKSFTSLLGLLALVWAACAIHAYAINSVLLHSFARVSPIAFFRKIFPAQMTAFTTQSSIGTLPVTTGQLTRKVGVHSEVAHFTAPLGANIGMPGCAGIWPILIAVWGINAYGLAYSPAKYAVLVVLSITVSIGVAGVPGAATVSAATVMAAANLPLEFVAATIPISVIADMARTATNVTAAAVSSTIVARQTGMLDDAIFDGRAEYVEDRPPARPVSPPVLRQPLPAQVYAPAPPAQVYAQHHPQPVANGHGQPVATGYAQPVLPGHAQPVANGFPQPVPAQHHPQPAPGGYGYPAPQPVANAYAQPAPPHAYPVPPHPQPVANGYAAPYSSQPLAHGYVPPVHPPQGYAQPVAHPQAYQQPTVPFPGPPALGIPVAAATPPRPDELVRS